MKIFTQTKEILNQTFLDTAKISKRVFKIIIPITILMKILVELDFIKYLAAPLEPIMALVGLPAEYGLAFAISLFVNLYSGIVVVMSIISEIGMPTVAEASIFSLMVLFAHNLLLEGKITQECGVSFLSQTVIRLVIAILSGIGLNLFYIYTGFHSEAAVILLEVPKDTSFIVWLLDELTNLFKIFMLIWLVLVMHTILTIIHVTDILEKMLSPFLKLLGLTKDTTSMLVVGFIAGIVSGSGLILKNTQEQKMKKKDLFCGITIMSLAHAIIEDTILMMLVGGSVWVTLVLRFFITLFAGMLLSFLYDKLQEKKYLQ